MLDPRFQKVEQEYARLRSQYEAGTITEAQFESALHGMLILHEGRYWSIGAGSGKWFVGEGGQWVEAVAPSLAEAPAFPPPAVPPASPGFPPPAPPASPAAPRPAAPHPVVSQPRSSGGRQVLARLGATLLFVGAASFILPFIGMQLNVMNLFGGGGPAVSAGLAIVGLILLLIGNSGGSSAVATPQRAAGPVVAQRPSSGCGWVVLIVLGLIVAGVLFAKMSGRIPPLIPPQASPPEMSSQLPVYTPTGLPPCPQGYTPPAPQLGSPNGAQQTCDPTITGP